MEKRSLYQDGTLKTRSKDESTEGSRFIEGYFLKFNNPTELWPGFSEEVSANAVRSLLTSNHDVKILYNHDNSLVLGSRNNQTALIKIDDVGVWCSVEINENDTEAMNAYQRVKRGDVTTCSFGFTVKPNGETVTYYDDGSTHVVLTDIDITELSIVAFPAYEDTGVEARHKRYNADLSQKLEEKRKGILKKYA